MTTDKEDDELITVQEFANRYRVSTETVRYWISKGYVAYELVGASKLIRRSSAVHPVAPVVAREA